MKLPLESLSSLWLFVNAAIGIAWWRIVMLKRARADRLVTIPIGLAMAFHYAIYNEETMAAFMLFILAAGIGHAVAPHLSRHPWFARLTIGDASNSDSAARRARFVSTGRQHSPSTLLHSGSGQTARCASLCSARAWHAKQREDRLLSRQS